MSRRRNNSTSLAASFDGMRSDYSAAKQSQFRRRRNGINSMGSSADYHYRSDAEYLRMMEYARDMDRNDVIVGRMLDVARDQTIQGGLWPDPDTGNAEADDLLKREFRAWANDPMRASSDGTRTWVSIQETAFRSMLCDGDIFAIVSDEGAVQLIEAHRCRTPYNTKRNVVSGILLDSQRRRLEYWFTPDDIDPNMAFDRVSDAQIYTAFDESGLPIVIHFYDPKRASQTRGITALARVFDLAGMFEDIQFAKLVQQQIVSCFAIIRELELGARNESDPRYGEQEVQAYSDATRKITEQIAPGMEIVGNPGETITGFSPNIPNPEAMKHFELMLTMLGVNLGLPLMLLLLDSKGSNFSGWRGAMDQAKIGFKRNQRILIEQFLRPIYLWKVRQFIDTKTGHPRLAELAAKLEASGGDIYAHAWNQPRWPYIEPHKDIQADELRIKARLSSRRRVLADRGEDVDEVVPEIIAGNEWEIDLAAQATARLREKHPEILANLDWHELFYVPNAIELKPGLPSSPTTSEDAMSGEAVNA